MANWDLHETGAKNPGADLLREVGHGSTPSSTGDHRLAPEGITALDRSRVYLIGRVFTTDRPNVCWLSDITYIPTREGWLYLSSVRFCIPAMGMSTFERGADKRCHELI